jgi:hypothetical protein
MQIRERDARHAQLLGESVEPLAQLRRIVLDHMDADVGVEPICVGCDEGAANPLAQPGRSDDRRARPTDRLPPANPGR